MYRPLLLAQRATIVLLDPERHAAVVKRVVALAPDDHAVLSAVNLLLAFRLASQTGVHNLDSANGTGVALHVPAPHSHGVPLLQGEHLIVLLVIAVEPVSWVLLGVGHV